MKIGDIRRHRKLLNLKIGDIVIVPRTSKIGLVVDLDLCNSDAYVMWKTKITWSEISYLEVVS